MRNNRRVENSKQPRSGSFKDQKKNAKRNTREKSEDERWEEYKRSYKSEQGNGRGEDRRSDRRNARGEDRGNSRWNDRGDDRRSSRGNDRFGDSRKKSDYTKDKSGGKREFAGGRRQEPDPDFDQNPNRLEGRNAVLEAFRSGRTVDKVYLQVDLHDGMILTIAREARKAGCIISYVPKNRLDQMSETGSHQGVIALVASFEYAEVEDILQKAKEKGEDPFIFLLDGIEDPHNLGAIIRTANLAGAHGVIITKHRAVGLTATVAKSSAGAINYTPVAKVTNMATTIEELKAQGMWFVCAAMDGTRMYDLNLKGAIGLVIGNEGEGVSRLVREKCDYTASIPMKGDIDSLNASVAAGVMAFEIVRQRG